MLHKLTSKFSLRDNNSYNYTQYTVYEKIYNHLLLKLRIWVTLWQLCEPWGLWEVAESSKTKNQLVKLKLGEKHTLSEVKNELSHIVYMTIKLFILMSCTYKGPKDISPT